MTLGIAEYLAGFAYLTVVLAACAAAGMTLVERRAPHLRGLVRLLGGFLGASAALVLTHLVPAALGVLSRPAVLVACALVLGAARLLRPLAAGAPDPAAAGREPRASRALAWAAVLLTAVAVLGFLRSRAGVPVTAVDAMTVHLPTVAHWIQTGSLWELVLHAPELTYATYPHNGTLLMTAVTLPWDSTFAVRYVGPPLMAVAALAVFAFARELGAPRSAAALAAAAVVAMQSVVLPSLEDAQVDPPMWAWFGAGALFLLRSARRPEPGELLLAGIGLGLAFGTKWYAVAYVPVLVALWLLARRRRDGAWLPILRRSPLLLVPLALLGGFWLLRNWVLAGNPVYPAAVPPLFDAPRNALYAFAAHEVSDYLFDPAIWRDWYVPAYRSSFGVGGPLLVLATLAAAAVALRRRAAAPALVAAAVVLIALVYSRLPFGAFGPEGQPYLVGANARWLVPAVMGAAALAAWLAAAVPRARPLVEALLFAAVVAGVAQWAPEAGAGPLLAGALVVAAVALARRAPRPVLAATALALALLTGAVLRANGGPADYRPLEPTVRALLDRVPSGGAVGLAGTWDLHGLAPALAAFGPRLDNRVEYLGRERDHLLVQWRERKAFQRAVRRGAYDAVLIGTGIPARRGGEEPHAGWVRDLGYREVARSQRLVLFVR
ncbi:MAG TPA: phospholipid carrier-dependent glycosyltransferase [Solirubrobacteraceae bacterium]|nr:phospholipid carrier-dependent glycosyltransferase [Solirubrobacteraceae bacterium]